MNIAPQTTKGVSYQISNPQDLSTLYYVRCVVRNTLTLAIIKTINLTSQGNGLYTGSYFVPADPTGLGYDIFETVSVYTDSGYTTLSPNYQIVNTPIRVNFELTAGTFGGANAGGYQPDLTDYEFIRKLLAEELALLPKPEKVDLKHLEEATRRLANGLTAAMKIHREEVTKLFNEHKKNTEKSLASISNSISSVGNLVGKIPLSQVIDQMNNGFTGLKEMHESHGKIIKDLSDSYGKTKEELQNRHEEIKTEMQARFDKHLKDTQDALSDYFSSVDTMVVNKGLPRPEREKPQYDFLADVKRFSLIK